MKFGRSVLHSSFRLAGPSGRNLGMHYSLRSNPIRSRVSYRSNLFDVVLDAGDLRWAASCKEFSCSILKTSCMWTVSVCERRLARTGELEICRLLTLIDVSYRNASSICYHSRSRTAMEGIVLLLVEHNLYYMHYPEVFRTFVRIARTLQSVAYRLAYKYMA